MLLFLSNCENEMLSNTKEKLLKTFKLFGTKMFGTSIRKVKKVKLSSLVPARFGSRIQGSQESTQIGRKGRWRGSRNG